MADDDLERLRARVERLEDQLAAIRGSRSWRLVDAWWRLRERVRDRLSPSPEPEQGREGDGDRRRPSPTDPDARPAGAATSGPGSTAPGVAAGSRVDPSDPATLVPFRDDLADWVDRARRAPGDTVVVMFSGTTFVQQRRGNRPIRLTDVYLDAGCPVFFNYYRWRTDEDLPDHPDDLLFQSPIDVTPAVLDDVFAADLGDRRRIYYVSFPHVDALRAIPVAAANGWAVVYDIRDDWEAFREVGYADWFDPALERWTVQVADVVTAVSQPLAEKLRVDAGRDDVHVNANAFDPSFPPRPDRSAARDGSPTVGYFGHLTERWFDWPLLAAVARSLPDWSFELAGHGAPEGLDVPQNVDLLGKLSHEQLAAHSARWAGGLIPFKPGAIVDPLDPIKVYEYIHLGLPTVAGFYPPIRRYPGVELCESVEDWVAAIRRLPERSVSVEAAADFLAGNTWQDRVREYARLVDAAGASGGTRGAFSGYLRATEVARTREAG